MFESLIRPLRPAPLGLCLTLSGLDTVLYRPGVWGALVHVLALLVTLRYGYWIIERRAAGSRGDAITDWRSFNQGFEEPFKLVIVIALFAVVHGVTTHYAGKGAARVVLVMANLLAPAIALIIGLDGSIVNALSPARIAALIGRIGPSYWAACLVLAVFSVAGDMVLSVLLAAASGSLRLFIYGFCSFYYILAVFFTMGWLVALRREELIG
ncbi:MAG: hypothetical protein WB783_16905 [Arenicellales bacterium]